MIKNNVFKMLVSSLLLAACTPVLGTVSPLKSTGSSQMQKSQQISGYLMRVAATFKTQAVNETHAQLIRENIQAFEEDLSQGRLDAYYQLPDFSIQLLAHSEGSYFTSPDNLNEFTNSNAAFARALVIYPDQSYDIFKGQFANQRFYFSGAESLPANNTSYLITLDQDLKPRVVSGQLEGQSASATPLPSASPVVLPTPSVLPVPSPSVTASPTASATALPAGNPRPSAALPPEQRFSPALAQFRQRAGEFNQQIRGFLPGPPPPPPPQARGQFAPPPGAPPLPRDQRPGSPMPGSSMPAPPLPGAPLPPGPPPALLPPEIMERLSQERPAVLAEIQALAGLPPQEHYAAMQKIQARNADLIPELGPPPPPSEASPQP